MRRIPISALYRDVVERSTKHDDGTMSIRFISHRVLLITDTPDGQIMDAYGP